jgi:predicted FMN-binding regulatory protein PaiB
MEIEEIEDLKKQAKVISEARIENMRGYDKMVQEKNSNFVNNAYKALYGKNKASNK